MKRQQLAIVAAVIALVYLFILWPLSVGAQSGPTPTATPTLIVAPTPRPLTVPCPPWRKCQYLPIGATA